MINFEKIKRVKRILAPHYLIICEGKAIGCTCGKTGKKEVLAEEPLATFKRTSKRKCHVCREFKS